MNNRSAEADPTHSSIRTVRMQAGKPAPQSLLLPELLPPRLAGLLHLALRGGAAQAVELRHAERPLLHPVAGEHALLRFPEDLANLVLVHHPRAARPHGELRRP